MSTAKWLAVFLVGSMGVCAALQWWPATVRVCVTNRTAHVLRDVLFSYGPHRFPRDVLQPGEHYECSVKAIAVDDGAKLTVRSSNGGKTPVSLPFYFSHGDYGTYHVMIDEGGVEIGPLYRNGYFSVLREAEPCDGVTGDARYVRVPASTLP